MIRIALLLSFLFVLPLQADSPKVPKAYSLEAIDQFVAAEQKAKGYIGLQLAIVRDGKVVLAKSYGDRSLEPKLPVTNDTSFRIGSVSKQFTCAAILLLAEDGKLAVTDKVAKYFPKLTKADTITLLDLMNHTSGYRDYYPLDFVDRRMQKEITIEQLAADYAGGKLDFEPGSRYSYSNTGYMLLGDIAEKVSGEKLGTFLKRRIFEPLKMEHTGYLGAPLPQKATGYWSFALGDPEKATDEPDGWIGGAGGIWSTALDLATWDLALVSGRVLKPESYKLMTSPRKLTNGKISDYGCGLRVSTFNGERTIGHSGAVFGFLANNMAFPRTRSAVVLLSNTEHVRPNTLYRSIVELVAKDQDEKDSAAVPKVDGPDAKKVVLDFLHDLQDGKIDRSNLGEEFSLYMTDERVKSAAARLKALGEPEKVVVGTASERGGMATQTVTLTFKKRVVKASLYRTPDGKVQQIIFNNE